MIKFTLFLFLVIVSFSCITETPVSEGRIYGLYKREFNNATEYLCIRPDKTYSHFKLDSKFLKELAQNTWHFDLNSKESRIGLTHFEKMGVSAPIFFLLSKKAIVIQMDADDYSNKFIMVDSVTCDVR